MDGSISSEATLYIDGLPLKGVYARESAHYQTEIAAARRHMREHARAYMHEALQRALTKQERDLYPAHTPMPTFEETRAALHRMANPTPADRAAEMLNARFGKRPAAPKFSADWEDFKMSGDRQLQAVVSARRVIARTAHTYVLH